MRDYGYETVTFEEHGLSLRSDGRVLMSDINNTLSGWVDGAVNGVSNFFNGPTASSFGQKATQAWNWLTGKLSEVYNSPNSGSIIGGIAGGLLAYMGYNAFAEGGIIGWLGLLLIPFGIIAGSAVARNSGWFGPPQQHTAVQPQRGQQRYRQYGDVGQPDYVQTASVQSPPVVDLGQTHPDLARAIVTASNPRYETVSLPAGQTVPPQPVITAALGPAQTIEQGHGSRA